MRTTKIIGLLFALVLSFSSIAAAQNVAIMAAANSTWISEVQGKLSATGLLTNVDVFDISVATPSLAQMQGYNAILVFTDDSPADSTTFGNNLANYVDGGGGVVASVFATASVPIEGRFNSDNYWAIQPTGQQQGTVATLGAIFVPDHPILNGVTTFHGGSSSYRPSADSLNPNATRIANWTGSDNIALIATRMIDGVRRVDLGFYPPSDDSRNDFWDSSTDGARIMANALLWVANESPSVTPIPTLNEWGFILLSLILAASAIRVIGKRRSGAVL